jgi:predicted nucleic acid-binding protein
MTPVFADTFHYLAILDPTDESHERALELSRRLRRRVVTTAWVLTEVGDALCEPTNRGIFTGLIRLLKGDANTDIVPASQDVFERGLDLHSHRPDKAWSLTDFISFVVMTERGLTDALTGDHHFEQAGFKALLRPA